MIKNVVENLLLKIKETEAPIDKMMRAPGKVITEADGLSMCINDITDDWFMEQTNEIKNHYLEKTALKILILFKLTCSFEVRDKIKFTNTFAALFMTVVEYLKLFRPKDNNLTMAIFLGYGEGKLILGMSGFQNTKRLYTVSAKIKND